MLFFRGLGRIQQDGDTLPASSPTYTRSPRPVYTEPTADTTPVTTVYVPPPTTVQTFPGPLATDYNWDAAQAYDLPANAPTEVVLYPETRPIDPVYTPPPPQNPVYTPPPPQDPVYVPPHPSQVETAPPPSAGTQVTTTPDVQPPPPYPMPTDPWVPPPHPQQYEDPMSSAETPPSAGTQINVGPFPPSTPSATSPRSWLNAFRSLTPVQKGVFGLGLGIAALGAVAAGAIHHRRKKQ